MVVERVGTKQRHVVADAADLLPHRVDHALRVARGPHEKVRIEREAMGEREPGLRHDRIADAAVERILCDADDLEDRIGDGCRLHRRQLRQHDGASDRILRSQIPLDERFVDDRHLAPRLHIGAREIAALDQAEHGGLTVAIAHEEHQRAARRTQRRARNGELCLIAAGRDRGRLHARHGRESIQDAVKQRLPLIDARVRRRKAEPGSEQPLRRGVIGTCTNLMKLRISTPAPSSSTTDSVTSATTSPLRRRVVAASMCRRGCPCRCRRSVRGARSGTPGTGRR